MAKPIKMPKLSDQMTEGRIVEWVKHEGDEVKAGDVLAQVETEKATLDVEAFDAGVLIGVTVQAGASAPVGQAIGWIGARGEQVPSAEGEKATRPDRAQAPGSGSEGTAGAGARAGEPPASGSRPAPARTAARTAGDRVHASPAARKAARERGIELGELEGSGPGGRVVLTDVEGAAPAGRPPHPTSPPAPRGERREAPGRRPLPPRAELRDETLPLSPMRRAIARSLAASKPGAPHFYLESSADARRLVALREQLAELDRGPVSVNDLVVKAVAEALARHPEVNAAWGADAIVRRGSVDVGVAVALDDGLVTPVVRGADRKDVFAVAAELRDLAVRARERRLRPEEYQGGSFTVSNLGMFGIEHFLAVLNPPEAAILAVGAIVKVPWVDEGTGALVAMDRLRLGLSCDHRVVDGATGARYLQTLKAILEAPVRLVIP